MRQNPLKSLFRGFSLSSMGSLRHSGIPTRPEFISGVYNGYVISMVDFPVSGRWEVLKYSGRSTMCISYFCSLLPLPTAVGKAHSLMEAPRQHCSRIIRPTGSFSRIMFTIFSLSFQYVTVLSDTPSPYSNKNWKVFTNAGLPYSFSDSKRALSPILW